MVDFLCEASHFLPVDLPALFPHVPNPKIDKHRSPNVASRLKTSNHRHKPTPSSLLNPQRIQKHKTIHSHRLKTRRLHRRHETSLKHSSKALSITPQLRINSENISVESSSESVNESSSENSDRQTVLKSSQSLEPWKAQVQLTSKHTCEDLTALAVSFGQSLEELQFEERKNNKPIKTTLALDDIKNLVQFFFHDVFGLPCQERIYKLMDELSSEDRAVDQINPGAIATERATDIALLPEVRVFFSKYSSWHRGEVDTSKIYPIVLQTIRAYELYASFVTLREAASSSSGTQLRQFLANKGFIQSRGVDIRTCILRYLCQELNMTSTQLNNTLQAQLGIYSLVQEFGPGILVLLPKVASYRQVSLII